LSKKNINVGYEPFFTVTQERRGGSRCGLDKFELFRDGRFGSSAPFQSSIV
jgi:hypothetical protein